MNMTHLEGRWVYKDAFEEVDRMNIQAYVGILILSGVYRSKNESTISLWDIAIFQATMPLKTLSCPRCCNLTTGTQDLAAIDKPSWHP